MTSGKSGLMCSAFKMLISVLSNKAVLDQGRGGLSGRSQRGPTGGGDHGPKTDELLAKLKVEVQSKKNKNVEVLQLAENITRSVGHLSLSFYLF